MRMRLLRGLCVALLCGAWAGAETLDEAIARLTKAAAETRDVTVSYQQKVGDKTAIAAELQVLRDGEKCLARLVRIITSKREGKDPAAPPEKRETRLLAMNDGQFLWTELRSAGRDDVVVTKERAPAGGVMAGLLFRGMPFLDAAFRINGFRAALEKEGGIWGACEVAGKGSVANRPTTVIEVVLRPVVPPGLHKVSEIAHGKMVVQFDDATGAALSVQDRLPSGDVRTRFSATEVKTNTGLDKKLFAYTPPEGANVRDRTTDAAPPTTPEEKPAP